VSELPIRLNRQQNSKMERFTGRHPEASWWLQRIEGTGLKFWRLTVSTGPDWSGIHNELEGKTLDEIIDLADRWFVDRESIRDGAQ